MVRRLTPGEYRNETMKAINPIQDHGNLRAEFEALRRMKVPALRARHREVVGTPSRSCSRQFLVRRIAWELQAQRYGGFSDRALDRAREIAKDTPIRLRSWKQTPLPETGLSPDRSATATVVAHGDDRLPMPGTLLRKDYRGKTIVVKVLDTGFEYEREVFPSLTALAMHITGTKWNGFLFFGLTKPKADLPRRKERRRNGKG